MAHRLGVVPDRPLTAEEHNEWALKLWERMDRDGSGSMTAEELNCDEFQDVLKSVIAPDLVGKVGAKATYGRSCINIEQTIAFCMQKAGQNQDGTLSFKEFRSLLRMLRNDNMASSTGNLIFALFDLDGNQTLEKEEFMEVFRFYLGHRPTLAQFEEEWGTLDKEGAGFVTREQYTTWLQRNKNPIFRQHAPPVALGSDSGSVASRSGAPRRATRPYRPAPGLTPESFAEGGFKPPWNPRFRGQDTTLINPAMPRRMKSYFSRPASLPELRRFYTTHIGFQQYAKRVHEPEVPRKQGVLSNDTQPMTHPERHTPGGTMRRRGASTGEIVPWNDGWQTPRSNKVKKWEPGANLLRSTGKGPAFLFQGRDAPDD